MKISEIFYSIQGEGCLVGMPSVFVRVAGCNLRCGWCDTKYAWDPSQGDEMTIAEIVSRVESYSTPYAVLTGGEPMMAEGVNELAAELEKRSIHLTIESNATCPPDGVRCHLASLSPKLDAAARPKDLPIERQVEIVEEWLVSYDCQLKFVIATRSDVDAVVDFIEILPVAVDTERILLMPEGATAAEVAEKAPMVAELCRENGLRYGQRLHLQLYGSGKGC